MQMQMQQPTCSTTADGPVVVHGAVQLMANILNYLSVSMYEGSFKQCHQEALRELNAIYDSAAHREPGAPPSRADCLSFYDNLVFLSQVTETDDPDYIVYKRKLKQWSNTLV
jgi:hypothetical protein